MYSSIRINCILKKYWYYPNIFTFSRSSWASRPFNTVDELIAVLDLDPREPKKILSNGGDAAIDIFNSVQKLYGYDFKINPKTKNYDETFIYEEKVDDNITIIWNHKSIKKVLKGRMPFVSKTFLINEFKGFKDSKIIWTGSIFNWYKEK